MDHIADHHPDDRSVGHLHHQRAVDADIDRRAHEVLPIALGTHHPPDGGRPFPVGIPERRRTIGTPEHGQPTVEGLQNLVQEGRWLDLDSYASQGHGSRRCIVAGSRPRHVDSHADHHGR